MSCSAGHRLGSDPALLWLRCGLAAAALIQPLAWESTYAEGAALKKKKKKNKEKRLPCGLFGVPVVAQQKQSN